MSISIHCPDGHPVVVAAAKVGSEVACPRCLALFLAEINLEGARSARAEKGKPRRPRDDDDEDEEDEKPRKKAKPSKAKKTEDDEDEKPPKKAKPSKGKTADDVEEDEDDEKPRKKGKPSKTKKGDDEDDDEDDEVEDGEPEEEEAPIEWTPRKRQLNICGHGLMVVIIACHLMVAFTVFTLLAIDYYEIFEDFRKEDWRGGLAYYLFYYAAVPFLYLATAALMVAMVISFAVPAKAGARAGILSTLVFGGLVFFLGLLLILTKTTTMIAEDPLREASMTQLLVGLSMLCFVICLLSTMGYMSNLLVFMKMHLESSEPITNSAFVLLCYVVLLILVTFLSFMAKNNVGDWMCWVISLLTDVCAGYAIFMLVTQVRLTMKLRTAIQKYIRD